jgi:hypothetical protein
MSFLGSIWSLSRFKLLNDKNLGGTNNSWMMKILGEDEPLAVALYLLCL